MVLSRNKTKLGIVVCGIIYWSAVAETSRRAGASGRMASHLAAAAARVAHRAACPRRPLHFQSAYKSDIDNDVAIASIPKFVQNPISRARESPNPQKFG